MEGEGTLYISFTKMKIGLHAGLTWLRNRLSKTKTYKGISQGPRDV